MRHVWLSLSLTCFWDLQWEGLLGWLEYYPTLRTLTASLIIVLPCLMALWNYDKFSFVHPVILTEVWLQPLCFTPYDYCVMFILVDKLGTHLDCGAEKSFGCQVLGTVTSLTSASLGGALAHTVLSISMFGHESSLRWPQKR